ncbi:MAG: hypothetical protein C4548_12970 [Desulfobacteraceae bacterium]|nr:MAG: hypothetical protein C4548_12970 [Desulfobacteraceae bacterium]
MSSRKDVYIKQPAPDQTNTPARGRCIIHFVFAEFMRVFILEPDRIRIYNCFSFGGQNMESVRSGIKK